MSREHRRIPRRQWRALRRRVFERDGFRCRACGRAGRLECDHVVPLDQGGAALDPANLQTLCRGCHIGKTRRENTERDNPERAAWRRFLAKSAY